MEYFVGLDVSLRSCALCIVDNRGKVLLERELPCEVVDIAECLRAFSRPIERVGSGESHEGYVRRICSKNRLFHPAFLRMTLSDFLSFALLSRFIAMCLMTAKFLGP